MGSGFYLRGAETFVLQGRKLIRYLRQAQTQAMAKRAGDGGIGIQKVVGWVGLQLV